VFWKQNNHKACSSMFSFVNGRKWKHPLKISGICYERITYDEAKRLGEVTDVANFEGAIPEVAGDPTEIRT